MTDDDLYAWAEELAIKCGSALNMWMSDEQLRKLYAVVARGGKVKTRVFEISERRPYHETVARLVRQLKPQGWRLFAAEDNYDQGEAVFVKTAPRAGRRAAGDLVAAVTKLTR